MFQKEYAFRGSHAKKVVELTAQFDKNHNKLFKRNLDVYMIAPIIGFLYNRKAELDRSTQETTVIFPEQLSNERNNMLFTYRLIILSDKEHEPEFNKRVDKAFRYYGKPEAQPDEELYEQYVRGGIDVLYEKILSKVSAEDDYLKNLYDFVEEVDTRYNSKISSEDIFNLCREIRG